MKILVTGGIKSGKSSYALKLAENFNQEKYFLATAISSDPEMQEKIDRHKTERDPSFNTIEEPIYINKHPHNNLIFDCVTIWVNNLFFYKMENKWENILNEFLTNIDNNLIIVSNEINLGNVAADKLTRKYNNFLGIINQYIAEKMDEVYFMVSGIPLKIK